MRRPRLIAVLPTLLTLGNAACGFGAITLAAKLGPGLVEGPQQLLFYAGLLIFLGMLCDMLDGSAARLTGQTSEIGAQLDSLCDAVTFGVAPAFIMLQFVEHALDGYEVPFLYPKRLVWTIACLYSLCAIMRLARFNVETDDDDSHEEFSGLPSPAAAGTVAAFPIAMPELFKIAADSGSWAPWINGTVIPLVRLSVPLVTLAVAALMVSRIRYPHFLTQLLRGRKPRRTLIQLLFGAAILFLFHELALPIAFCWFALASPVKALWFEVFPVRSHSAADPSAADLPGRVPEESEQAV